MTKETQTQAIAEPFKFKNAALLNRLSEMAQVPYYATACHTLIQAEMAIVELERENATLRAEVERLAAQAAPTEPTDYKALGLSLLAKAQAQVFDSDAASNEAFDNTFHKIAADVSRDRWNKIWRMAAQWQRYYTIRNRGAQSPAQAPVQPVSLTDVLQAAAPAEIADAQAPVVLAVQPEYCTACDMTSNDKQRCEDCPRRASSGAAQAVRMLTREELNDVALSEQVGWGPGEYVEAVQRKFAEVNGLRIPADGKIGDAA